MRPPPDSALNATSVKSPVQATNELRRKLMLSRAVNKRHDSDLSLDHQSSNTPLTTPDTAEPPTSPSAPSGISADTSAQDASDSEEGEISEDEPASPSVISKPEQPSPRTANYTPDMDVEQWYEGRRASEPARPGVLRDDVTVAAFVECKLLILDLLASGVPKDTIMEITGLSPKFIVVAFGELGLKLPNNIRPEDIPPLPPGSPVPQAFIESGVIRASQSLSPVLVVAPGPPPEPAEEMAIDPSSQPASGIHVDRSCAPSPTKPASVTAPARSAGQSVATAPSKLEGLKRVLQERRNRSVASPGISTDGQPEQPVAPKFSGRAKNGSVPKSAPRHSAILQEKIDSGSVTPSLPSSRATGPSSGTERRSSRDTLLAAKLAKLKAKLPEAPQSPASSLPPKPLAAVINGTAPAETNRTTDSEPKHLDVPTAVPSTPPSATTVLCTPHSTTPSRPSGLQDVSASTLNSVQTPSSATFTAVPSSSSTSGFPQMPSRSSTLEHLPRVRSGKRLRATDLFDGPSEVDLFMPACPEFYPVIIDMSDDSDMSEVDRPKRIASPIIVEDLHRAETPIQDIPASSVDDFLRPLFDELAPKGFSAATRSPNIDAAAELKRLKQAIARAEAERAVKRARYEPSDSEAYPAVHDRRHHMRRLQDADSLMDYEVDTMPDVHDVQSGPSTFHCTHRSSDAPVDAMHAQSIHELEEETDMFLVDGDGNEHAPPECSVIPRDSENTLRKSKLDKTHQGELTAFFDHWLEVPQRGTLELLHKPTSSKLQTAPTGPNTLQQTQTGRWTDYQSPFGSEGVTSPPNAPVDAVYHSQGIIDLSPLRQKAFSRLADGKNTICPFEIPGGGQCMDGTCKHAHTRDLQPTDAELARFLCGIFPTLQTARIIPLLSGNSKLHSLGVAGRVTYVLDRFGLR